MLIVGGMVCVVFLMPHAIVGDGAVRYETLKTLMHTGQLSAARYSIVQPLLSIPWWLVGEIIGNTEAACAYFNPIIFCLFLCGLLVLLTDIADGTLARLTVLLLLCTGMFPHHAQTYDGQLLTAASIGGGIALYVLDRPFWGLPLAVIGIVQTPPTAVAFLLFALFWGARSRRWVAAFLPLLLSASLILLEFYVRRGSPFASGYEGDVGYRTVMPYSGRPGFSFPLLLGILSICFSFGKGIAFYMPGLWLGLRTNRASSPKTDLLLKGTMLFVLGLVLVYAKWWAWYGGLFWGPRFFLFACIPASLALALRLRFGQASPRSNVVTLIVLAWSVWVGVDGAVYSQYGLGICFANHYQLEHLCWYVPEFSALLHPFIQPKPLSVRETVVVMYFAACFVWLAVSPCREILRRYVHVSRQVDANPQPPAGPTAGLSGPSSLKSLAPAPNKCCPDPDRGAGPIG